LRSVKKESSTGSNQEYSRRRSKEFRLDVGFRKTEFPLRTILSGVRRSRTESKDPHNAKTATAAAVLLYSDLDFPTFNSTGNQTTNA